MSPSLPPLSKADRLAIGGAVAPAVRRQADAPRVVTVVGKDGQPVRQTTAVEVAKSVLARADVEFSVQEGKRPEWVKCKTCGAPVKVPIKGKLPMKCRGGTHRCPCGKLIRTAGACRLGGLCKSCTAGSTIRRFRPEAPSNRRHSDEEIRAAMAAASTVQQAAHALGLAESTLCARVKGLGVSPRPTECPCGVSFARGASAVGGHPPKWCPDCRASAKRRNAAKRSAGNQRREAA